MLFSMQFVVTCIEMPHSVASRRNGGRSCPFRDAENAAAISRYGLEMERHDSGVRTRAADCVFWRVQHSILIWTVIITSAFSISFDFRCMK